MLLIAAMICAAAFLVGCTKETEQIQSNLPTQKYLVEVVDLELAVSNNAFAEKSKEFGFWQRQAKDMLDEKTLSQEKYDKVYKYALIVLDGNFRPAEYVQSHRDSDLTIAGKVFKMGDEKITYRDVVLTNSIDLNFFTLQ